MDNLTLDRKKLTIIAGGLVAVLVILISLTALISSATKKSGDTASQVNQAAKIKEQIIPALPLPKVQVSQWLDSNTAPRSIPTSQLYAFKSVNPAVDAATLSQKIMGTDKVKKTAKGMYIATLSSDTGNDLSAFVYNPQKGEFSYASTHGILLPGASTAPVAERVNNLVNALYIDPTLKISAQYKRKDRQGITYFEVHRDWNAVGFPILNPLGLLNLPENQLLSNLNLKSTVGKADDTNVYATTDGSDGKARATDFNTLTVGVKDADGSVASLISNIRELQHAQLRVASLISYQAAFAKLKNKQYSFLYTSPAGGGTPNFDKVYPNNQAVAEQATIKESMIAYVELPPQSPQTDLLPYYFFRGTAELSSGYRVNFVAAVSAVDMTKPLAAALGVQDGTQSQATFAITGSPQAGHCGTALTCPPTPTLAPGHCGTGLTCPTPTLPPSLFATEAPGHCGSGLTCPPTPEPTPHCGSGLTCPPTPEPTPTCGQLGTCPPTPVPTGCNGGQCQGTFQITPQPTSTPQPIPPTNQPVNPPPTGNVCIPSTSELTNNRQVNGNTNIGQLTQAGLDHIRNNRIKNNEAIAVGDWYSYVNGGNLTAQDLIDSFNVAKQQDSSSSGPFGLNQRRGAFIDEDLANQPDCPIRITGGSPTIFVYGVAGQTVRISPQSSINYTEPAVEKGAWSVTVQKGGNLTVNGLSRDYLYYEYKPVSFSRPSVGWNIEKDNLNSFINTVAKLYGLNSSESERLYFEITQVASNISSNTLFIGPIDSSELNTKLPLSVTPHIPLTRLNFYVGEATASVIPPTVTPIVRTSSMILEIGAAGK